MRPYKGIKRCLLIGSASESGHGESMSPRKKGALSSIVSLGFGDRDRCEKMDKTDKEKEQDKNNILHHLQPDDLIKFGLIPEFIGRLPVMAVLDPLSEEALIDILVKPKNALTKQYARLFGFENVELKFTDAALKAIAEEAIRRKTGARGLRSVIETSMLDIMYEIPSKPEVKSCIIDEDVIRGKKSPKLIYRTEEEMKAEKLKQDSA